ncbi:hypothetical protein BOX15_Mlig003293g3, partial [Macrostomum lignano]
GGGGGGGGGDDGGGPDDPDSSPYYPMQSARRGRAILIQVTNFPPETNLPPRSLMDDSFYICFSRLGFDVLSLNNPSHETFGHLLTIDRQPEEYAEEDALVLCILSHGEQGYVYSADGSRVSLKNVYKQFRMCPQLKNKPKVFIVQANRGNVQARTVARSVGDLNVGQHEDCLYIHSVVKGSMCSGRFILTLCNILINQFDLMNDDLMSVLPFASHTTAATNENRTIACYRSTNRKRLRFPPLR